jgi:hypothetical protein
MGLEKVKHLAEGVPAKQCTGTYALHACVRQTVAEPLLPHRPL